MKAITFSVVILLGALLADVGVTGTDSEELDLLALHWHPATAVEARRRTLALGIWLESGELDARQWRSALESRLLGLERAAVRVPAEWALPADGILAWLVHARDQNLPGLRPALSPASLRRAGDLLGDERHGGRLARLYRPAALQAELIWQDLGARLEELERSDSDADDGGTDVQEDDPASFWRPLREGLAEAGPEAWMDHAREQASRVRAIAAAESQSRRQFLLAELLLAEARMERSRDRQLKAVWLYFEGLVRLAAADDVLLLAAAYQDDLFAWSDVEIASLRRLDVELPVVLAQMQDAAGYLAVEDPDRAVAVGELADAYARLALFASDIAFYLDQPVREDLRQVISDCNVDPGLVGPVPRELFESCLNRLTRLLVDELDREELVGGGGPFASEFLRREAGLVSWQRARYLDGHLDWRLQGGCGSPEWINPLEWSILVHYLANWVPQRPVFFGTARWQEAIDGIVSALDLHIDQRSAWLDCVTGMGGTRRDPVQRLLDRLERAQRELGELIDGAQRQFFDEVTRPGADIDLDAGADQATAYRPESLTVGPCPGVETCGARIELPVSRALLGRFPNAYLLADQIGLGELRLCYGQVGWVERQARPARAGDPRVANYFGQLSFELLGSFVQGEEEELVFQQRLVARESQHYLFAGAEPELLELACPRGLAGEPIASQLPDSRLALVPNRLTYFVSLPTTAEAQFQANWDRGAEWRDWFVTGDRVETLVQRDGDALTARVEAELASLASRRERQLAGRLLNPILPSADDALSLAMAEVVEFTTLIRRVLEIHYPRLLRHDDQLRSLVSGDAGLLGRDRVRHLRDQGVSMARLPAIGQQRLEQLREIWLSLPAELRESGQLAPELDYGLEQLEQLIVLSRQLLLVDELSPDP
ncbi:MAG: hypothetical protein JJU31_02735 [Wenzhouxiangella sp.]|nr:hypothetical protein [Wenzhouxiangella sp.]TVR93974.1 MAG: hypothetical protein EA418_11245 [Wenzhouxiangellaceae bacterium]